MMTPSRTGSIHREPIVRVVLRPGRHWGFRAGAALIVVITAPTYILAPETIFSVGGVIGLLVSLAFAGGLLSLSQRAVVVEIDGNRRTLSVAQRRWPLPGTLDAIPLDDITGVQVEENPRHGGGTYRVVLSKATGAPLPLTLSYYRGREYQDEFATTLREAAGWSRPR
jgi:hypothetical protein